MLNFGRGLPVAVPVVLGLALIAGSATSAPASSTADAKKPPRAQAVGKAPVRASAAAAWAAAQKDPVDLSGVWQVVYYPSQDFMPYPELTPEAQPYWDKVRAERAAGKSVDDPSAFCIPFGFPKELRRRQPMQIMRTANGFISIHELGSRIRVVRMDGHGHPSKDDLNPTINGDSVGHWEGKVLVVDTIGLQNEVAGFRVTPEIGVPTSPDLHVVERWTLSPKNDKVDIDITMEDPTVLAKPWKVQVTLLRKDDVEFEEDDCIAAANRETRAPDGSVTFKGVTK